MSKNRRWLKFLQVVMPKGPAGIIVLVLIIALACVLRATTPEAIYAISLFILAVILLIVVTFIVTRWEKKQDNSDPTEPADTDPPAKP
jgi:predicted membrane channel-forming protein YqfA (hemolysin III family)